MSITICTDKQIEPLANAKGHKCPTLTMHSMTVASTSFSYNLNPSRNGKGCKNRVPTCVRTGFALKGRSYPSSWTQGWEQDAGSHKSMMFNWERTFSPSPSYQNLQAKHRCHCQPQRTTLNIGGLLPKDISVPITSIQVSRIIIGTATVWSLFGKYVPDPIFFLF